MNKLVLVVLALFLFLIVINYPLAETGSNKSQTSNKFFGQDPPGDTPEVFARGIISTNLHEYSIAFSEKYQEVFFSRHIDDYSFIYKSHFKNGKLSKPEIAPFSGIYADYDQSLSQDENTLFFATDRPRKKTPYIGDIWFVERDGRGWSDPKNVGSPVNTKINEACPTVTKNKTIYYHAAYSKGYGSSDIYKSSLKDGQYTDPENLGKIINTQYGESNAFIAPDEKFLIFGSGRPGGFGSSDLYISFKDDKGIWSDPVNMGDKINSKSSEYCPSISSDGRFMFFTRISEKSQGDIFWVDAGIIEELKPGRIK